MRSSEQLDDLARMWTYLKYRRSRRGMGNREGTPRPGRRVMGRTASSTSRFGSILPAADLASGPSTGLASICAPLQCVIPTLTARLSRGHFGQHADQAKYRRCRSGTRRSLWLAQAGQGAVDYCCSQWGRRLQLALVHVNLASQARPAGATRLGD